MDVREVTGYVVMSFGDVCVYVNGSERSMCARGFDVPWIYIYIEARSCAGVIHAVLCNGKLNFQLVYGRVALGIPTED